MAFAHEYLQPHDSTGLARHLPEHLARSMPVRPCCKGNPLSARNTHAGRTVSSHIERGFLRTHLTQRGGTEWPAAACPGKSRISNRSRRASRANTIIESTFEVGSRFRCTMRV